MSDTRTIETLRPCPGCTRHIKTSEPVCPFCATALSAEFAAFSPTLPNKRMSRAALVALGATIALTGCAASTQPGDGSSRDVQDASAMQDDRPNMPEVSVSAYGLPPPPEDGGVAPPYGIPPGDF
jgi:hypothetical protein